MPPLLTAQNEKDIRTKLAEIFADAEANLFVVDRQILSKTHFEANTVKSVDGKNEIRYLEFRFTGYEDIDDENQMDAGCTPVRLLYEGQAGFQYVAERSDNSTSDDTASAFVINMRNNGLSNVDIFIPGKECTLSGIVQTVPLRIDRHPVMERDMHLWDFRFSVEVRN